MTELDTVTAEALRKFRDRAGHLIELIAQEPDVDLWGDVLLDEATLIIKRGPEKYLKYVARIDAKAAKHEESTP